MKTWKLVSGIISIVLSIFVLFQSCAAGIGNAMADNGEVSGSAGVMVAIAMIVFGIISIVIRKSSKKSGHIAVIVIAAIGAIMGFANAGSYTDLYIWSAWCVICAVMSVISMIKKNNDSTEI